MSLPLAIDSVNATFWLAVAVLLAAVGLSVFAALKGGDNSKQLFAIVGVLLGLFGAGGLGSLFANQAANEAAEKVAPEAAAAAVGELSGEAPSAASHSKPEKNPDSTPSKSGNRGSTE